MSLEGGYTVSMEAVAYTDLTRLVNRLTAVGVDADTAWLAAGRYTSGLVGWTTPLMDARREGLITSAVVMAATRILNGWVIR